jgi:hypothetical protein
MHHITHAEVIEGRQRIAKLNRLQGDFQEEQIKFQRFCQGLLNKYGLTGLKAQINWETSEIEVVPDRIHYTVADSLNACAMQDFFCEVEEKPASV